MSTQKTPETRPADTNLITCPICRGTGTLTVMAKPGATPDKPETETIGCYKCEGRGTVAAP